MSKDPKSTYYDVGGIETLDILKAKLTPEQYRGSLLGNVIKYACRLNFKGCAERDAEKLAIYSKELAAIACKQGGECMKIQRYELLDLSSADGPRAMVTERYDGAWYNRDQVQAELQRRLGFGDLVSCIQKADSWDQVAALLDELVPDWKCRLDLTRCDEALEAIRGLKARIAELEEELAASEK